MQGIHLGFPGGSDSKESTCNLGDPGSVPRSGRSPGGGNGTPVFLPGEAPWTEEPGELYSPWGHTESNTTELLTHTQSIHL